MGSIGVSACPMKVLAWGLVGVSELGTGGVAQN